MSSSSLNNLFYSSFKHRDTRVFCRTALAALNAYCYDINRNH